MLSNLFKQIIDFIQNLNRVSNKKGQILILAFFSLIGSLSEAIGLISLFPIITALTNYDILISLTSKYLSVNLNTYSREQIILFFCVLSLSLFIAKFIIVVSINYYLNSQSYELLSSTRRNLLNSILNLNYDNFINLDESQIINSILNTTHEFIELTFKPFIRLISEGILVILLFSILIFFYLNESLFILFVFILFLILYNYFIKNKIKYYGELSDQSNKTYIQFLKYNISGREELNILNISDKFVNLANLHLNNFIQSKKKSVFFEILPRSILEIIIFILINLLIIINILYNNNSNLLLDLSLMAVISLRLLPSINILVISFVQMRFSTYHFEKLNKLLKKYQVEDQLKSNKIENQVIDQIYLKNISYSYNNKIKVLENLDFNIQKNKTIGIFGDSGAGKTTLIKIILGIIKPDKGSILINGNITNISDFKRNFFYLKQENFLLNDTIKNNITLFENETFEDNKQKIKKILLDLNLIKSPDDFEQYIQNKLGDNGLKISGGQRQRIILARAIYFNKKYIIFDEPTSSLDFVNTNNMIRVFDSLKKFSTLIIVSHDKNLINSCDLKYQLKDKKILEII